MIYIHRFLGTWLDNNKGPNKNFIFSKAVAQGSEIIEYLKGYETRKKFMVSRKRFPSMIQGQIDIIGWRLKRIVC